MAKENKIDEADLTRALHSRAFTIIVTILSVVAAMAVSSLYDVTPFAENRGIAFSAVGSYVTDPNVSLAVNIVLTVGIALFLVYANGALSIVKGFSFLFAALYMFASVSMPQAMSFFYGGTTLCLTTIVAAALLLSTYQQPTRTLEVFLAFFLLSLGACFHWGQLVIAAIFLVGCGQMMIFSPKTVVAALLGMATPLWILLGFGIVGIDDLTIPVSANTLPVDNPMRLSYVIAFAVYGAFLGVVFGILNVLKMLSADARTRSINGFMFLLTLTVIILAAADYCNMPVYLPLISCCGAIQTGQFFAMNITRRSYIPIVVICLVYVGFFVWGIRL